jgi:ATP-dependent RNA helicase DDX21
MLAKKRETSKKEKTNGRKSSTKDTEESHDENELELKESKKERKGSKNKISNGTEEPKRKGSECRDEVESFGISPVVTQKLKERGITSLFDVQKQVFFPIFNGENTICASLTGSGKTLGFILPIIERCEKKGRFTHTDPCVLVLAPTRELAIQIGNEFKTLSGKTPNDPFYYKVATVYGGESIDNQIYALRKGCDIVVGTPGRVTDMINRGEIKLGSIKIGVLDEADRMLDLGFEKDIVDIYNWIYKESSKLQVALFSATIQPWVLTTAKKIMGGKEHTFVNLVKDLKGKCAVGVSHLALNCLRSEKVTAIADLSKLKLYILILKNIY